MYNNLKISICLCTYNGQGYLREQLESLYSQSIHFDELIIVDDKSSDQTLTILNEFIDGRCKIFSNENNLGPAKSFEKALTLSTGDLIFLCDQDDIWFENKIETMCQKLTEEKSQLCLSNCYVGEHKTSKELFFSQTPSFSFLQNLISNNFHGCCLAFTKETLEKALPFPQSTPMHDWWLGLIATKIGKVSYIDEPLMFYRRHDSAVTYKQKNSSLSKILWRVSLLKNLIFRK